ncbi:uncharacterized protein isoform X2 [Rhodnius prolixus]|uniref:uncharacterized protein isoform X2 n=1 Tax=Rhodnius prolixus TaxID=13249 RepID=UPI003D18C223
MEEEEEETTKSVISPKEISMKGEQTDSDEEQTDVMNEQVLFGEDSMYMGQKQIYLGEEEISTGEGGYKKVACGEEAVEEKDYIQKIKISLDLNELQKRMSILKSFLKNFKKDYEKYDQPYHPKLEELSISLEALEDKEAESELAGEEGEDVKDEEMMVLVEDMLDDDWLIKPKVLTPKQVQKLIKILKEIIAQIKSELGLLLEPSKATITSLGLCRGELGRKKREEFAKELEEERMMEEDGSLEDETIYFGDEKEAKDRKQTKKRLLKDYINAFFDDLMYKKLKHHRENSETDFGFDQNNEGNREAYVQDIFGETIPMDEVIRNELLRRIEVVKQKYGKDLYLDDQTETSEEEEYYVESKEEIFERKSAIEQEEIEEEESFKKASVEPEDRICERIFLSFEIEVVPPLKPFPYLSKNCSMNAKNFAIYHCFGFDPKKPYNLGEIDDVHLVFQSGNFVHFFNTDTRKIRSLPSIGGNAVGSIATNVKNKVIAVCEKGESPYIVVHQWPNYNIISVFESVFQEKEYIYSSLSSDGKLLCTQGSSPNNFVIVWSVSKNRLLATKKCNLYQVYKTEITSFSKHKAKIISCGIGFLIFWELAASYGSHKLYSRQIRKIPKKLSHLQTFALVPHLKVDKEEEEDTAMGMLTYKEDEEEEEKADEAHGAEPSKTEWAEPAKEVEASASNVDQKLDDDDEDVDYEEIGHEEEEIDYGENDEEAAVENAENMDEVPEEVAEKKQEEKEKKPKEELPILGDKVLTGTSEGNILIWHYNKMQCEITRRNELPMHEKGSIVFISFDPSNKNILTVGKDGYFRIWDYEVMYFESLTKSKEENRKLEMQESYEAKILDESGQPIEINYLIKKTTNLYFIQDPRGTIYSAILETSGENVMAHKIYETHAGAVTGIAPSPFHYYVAVITDIGEFIVYNSILKTLVLKKWFKIGCTAILWLPFELDFTGRVMVIGFNDGTLRVMFVAVRYKEEKVTDKECAVVTQVFKPHTAKITSIVLNHNSDIIASASHDGTVVIYETIPCQKHYVKLLAVHAVKIEGPVSYFCWKHSADVLAFLVSCTNGYFGEYILPNIKNYYRTTKPRYYLKVSKKGCYFKNVSHENKYFLPEKVRARVNKKMYYKRYLLRVEYEEMPNNNDEANFSDDSDYPIVPPEQPVSLYFAKYLSDEIVWVSAEKSHCGLFFEYILGQDEPSNITPICDAEDVPITCFLNLFDDRYMALGLQNGRVRVVKLNPQNWSDLSDYIEIPAHDPFNSHINQLCVSHDFKMLYSCGMDGNVIVYNLNFSKVNYAKYVAIPKSIVPPVLFIDRDIPPETPCIQKSKAEKVRAEQKAAKVEEIKEKIDEIRVQFEDLKKLNETLPPEERFTSDFFVLPSIKAELEKMKQSRIEEVTKKYNHQFYKVKTLLKNMKKYFSQDLQTHLVYLIGVKSKLKVTTYRTCKFDEFFLNIEKEVTEAVAEENRIHEFFESKKNPLPKVSYQKKDTKLDALDTFLLENIEFVKQLGKEKRKYFEKLYVSRHRMLFLKRQLAEFYDHPQGDIMDFIFREVDEEVEKELNLKRIKSCMKTNPSSDRLMYALIKCLRYIYNLKEDFNKEVLKVRDFKLQIVYDYYLGKRDMLYISREMKLPEGLENLKQPPFDRFLEFPESYCEGHPAKFLPESTVPPIPEAWNLEYEFIYGDEDPSIFICDDFPDDISLLRKRGLNMSQITKRIDRLKRFRSRLSEIASIDANLMIYDQLLEKVAYKKFCVDEKITQLTFIASSLYQELFIIRFYSILEDDINNKKESFIIRKCIYNLKIFALHNKRAAIDEAISESKKKLAAIELKAMEVIPPSNSLEHESIKFKFFTRSTKLCEDHGLSCSSFGEDSIGDESCDEGENKEKAKVNLYETMYKLRTKRNIERAAIHKAYNARKQLTEVLQFYTNRRIKCEVIIAMFVFQYLKLKDEKESQLKKMNIIFIVRPCELQCFDPKTNEVVSNVMFTTIDSVKKHEKTALDMGLEMDLAKKELRGMFSELRTMMAKIKQICEKKELLKSELKKSMLARFGREIDLRDLIDNTLKGMVLDEKERNEVFVSPYQVKVSQLQKKSREVRKEFLESIRENTCKTHIVCSVLEEKNKAFEYSLKPVLKSRFKRGYLEGELASLKEAIEVQEARRANILEAIDNLKNKGEFKELDSYETLLKKVRKKKKTCLPQMFPPRNIGRDLFVNKPESASVEEEKEILEQIAESLEVRSEELFEAAKKEEALLLQEDNEMGEEIIGVESEEVISETEMVEHLQENEEIRGEHEIEIGPEEEAIDKHYIEEEDIFMNEEDEEAVAVESDFGPFEEITVKNVDEERPEEEEDEEEPLVYEGPTTEELVFEEELIQEFEE